MECDVMLMRFFFFLKKMDPAKLSRPRAPDGSHTANGGTKCRALGSGQAPPINMDPAWGSSHVKETKCKRVWVFLLTIVMSHSARDATPARIFHFVSKILITWREARRTASPFFFCPQFFLPFSGSLPFPRPSLRSVGPPVTLSNKRKRRRPVQPASQPVSQPVPI